MSARRMFWTAFVVALALVFVGYTFEGKKSPTPAAATVVEQTIAPTDYGNGIYYFSAFGERYRHALVKFYADNPDMNCTYHGAIEKWDNGALRTIGHILHCRERDTATPAQDITVP